MTDTLEAYSVTVQTWKETPFDDLSQTAELMKDMAIVLSDLTMHKIEYKKKWNALVYKTTKETSVASAERLADAEIPELSQLREIIRAGTNILDSMRSQVSLLKLER